MTKIQTGWTIRTTWDEDAEAPRFQTEPVRAMGGEIEYYATSRGKWIGLAVDHGLKINWHAKPRRTPGEHHGKRSGNIRMRYPIPSLPGATIIEDCAVEAHRGKCEVYEPHQGQWYALASELQPFVTWHDA